MHLLESASEYFECIPVTHEVTAAIASEYFNQIDEERRKAFALVTAGPGFTNLVTGIAGAWLDSRELLVVGGQSKTSNLSRGTVRQLGHQEIDGVSISKSITKYSARLTDAWNQSDLYTAVSHSWLGRPGPVFLEVCLDISTKDIDLPFEKIDHAELGSISINSIEFESLKSNLKTAKRPLILLGGGVKWSTAKKFLKRIEKYRIPVACTWTGADRVGDDYEFFAGRPNTYGMRWANIFLQQSDLLIAVGSSLGFQQTGFNVEQFLPTGNLFHIDIDEHELNKINPKQRNALRLDSDVFLEILPSIINDNLQDIGEWIDFLRTVRRVIPTLEECQKSEEPFISPHEVISIVSELLQPNDCIVSASSGGTFTASMQIFSTTGNQRFLGNKGLASMGYGLAGAIGACFARPESRTVLFEGDGGFVQNSQELSTVIAQKLNLKIFVTSNDGYASIRTSQSNYFDGHYLGCDSRTGLLLPDWKIFASSFNVPYFELTQTSIRSAKFLEVFSTKGPAFFAIKADPEQIYLPKLPTKLNSSGVLETAALHDMFPPLDSEIEGTVFRYFDDSKFE